MADITKEYKTISQIAGPLIFVKKTEPVSYKEIVNIRLSDGSMRRGEVLDSSDDIVVVQVFEGTTGIDRDASVRFLGETMKMPVSKDMLGRVLSGAGDPLDGGAKIVPEQELDIVGAAINPWARDSPSDRPPPGADRPVHGSLLRAGEVHRAVFRLSSGELHGN